MSNLSNKKYTYKKKPIKEPCKRDLYKRPVKETCKRDILSLPDVLGL